jgi:aryl-alcohol dehydrogenase-like predicted oxidoreductase
MEQRALGRHGMQVPVVGMGTWLTFDVRGAADIEDRRTVVDAAISAGTTLFDTSPMYGASEEVLGGLLAGRREETIVADKVWTSSAREGREQVARALSWYGGRVDICQVHNLVAWREHLPMLEELRDRGVVRVIGATHYQHSAFRELMEVMRTGRIQMIQVPYNAADRAVERDVLPLAAELGIGVLVMQPLGTGKLVGRAPASQALAPLSRFGVRTWAQALLKWIVSDPRVHAVLPATRHAARAMENAAAGEPAWFDEDTRAYVARLATAR